MVLLAMALLEQGGDGRWTTEPDWLRSSIKLPSRHYETWNDVQVVALGALAFRTLASRGGLVQPTRSSPGARFHFEKGIVGRAWSELATPFEPMLELLSLGVRLVSLSHEAVTLHLT